MKPARQRMQDLSTRLELKGMGWSVLVFLVVGSGIGFVVLHEFLPTLESKRLPAGAALPLLLKFALAYTLGGALIMGCVQGLLWGAEAETQEQSGVGSRRVRCFAALQFVVLFGMVGVTDLGLQQWLTLTFLVGLAFSIGVALGFLLGRRGGSST
jgi:hypothetical protein